MAKSRELKAEKLRLPALRRRCEGRFAAPPQSYAAASPPQSYAALLRLAHRQLLLACALLIVLLRRRGGSFLKAEGAAQLSY